MNLKGYYLLRNQTLPEGRKMIPWNVIPGEENVYNGINDE
jgi:hypothetical protein